MSAKPQAKKKEDEERNYDLENEMMRRRIQTIREMITTKEKQIEDSEQRIGRLKEKCVCIDREFEAEAAKAESGYEELQQQYADMSTNYQRVLEGMKEQVAAAQRGNDLLEKEIVTAGLHKDHVIEGKRTMLQRLEREMEAMALEFSEILMVVWPVSGSLETATLSGFAITTDHIHSESASPKPSGQASRMRGAQPSLMCAER